MRFWGLVFFTLSLIVALPIAKAQSEQKRVDQIFSAYDKANSPGCAVGVIRDGNFVYRKAYGMGSLELGVPLSSQSVFYLGSLAKQFTAAAVVLAAEQGRLSLDDDVRKYLPELPDYGHVITLRQMLHHTSGLRDFLALFYLAGRDMANLHSNPEILDLIGRQKGLNNVPGDEFIYSNTNYFLLGEVVRRATKESLARFADENIFQPLGMKQTQFYDDRTRVVPGRVPAYYPGPDGNFLVGWSTNYETVGGGGLMSSVDDLLLWDRNFYEDKLGKGTLVKELQTRGVLNDGKRTDYALGLFMSTYRGLPIAAHEGANFGFRSAILRFPEQRFTTLCLCNVSSAAPFNLARQVSDIFLERELKPDKNAVESSGDASLPDSVEFAGKYLDPRKHEVYTFTASAGKLMGWGANLRRLGPRQFNDLEAGVLTFEESSGGMKVTLIQDDMVFFAGQRIEAPQLDEQEQAAYTGQYRSAELDATFDLAISSGSLVLRRNRDPERKLIPLASDEFESEELGNLVFHRGANRRVTGMSLFVDSARGLTFEKMK